MGELADDDAAEAYRLNDFSENPIGKRLLALRNKAIAEGMQLLSADEVLEEVKRRRGRKCPVCKRPMERVKNPDGIVFNVCWRDGGVEEAKDESLS